MHANELLSWEICTVFNLRAIDLNLLPVFEAAYEERSLSRAATRLAMTQPAVSHALARLRACFRDELFVRHSRGMTPTPGADALYARLGESLSLVRAAVGESRGFDPASSVRRFSVAIPHPLGPLLALGLIESVRAVAPGITLAFDTRSRPVDLERSMAEGQTDAAVDWLPTRTAAFSQEALFEDRLVAVVRKDHPALRRDRTWADLAGRREFVQLRARIEGEGHPIEVVRELRRLGARTALEVSEFLEVPVVVNQSDLVGILPASIAKQAQKVLGLRILKLSPESRALPVRLLWRTNRDADPALRFLLGHVRKAAARVAAGAKAA